MSLNHRNINVGDYIRVDKIDNYFDQCFMYVDEVKDWGVMAGMCVPDKGWTFVNLKWDEFIIVGRRAR